MPPVRSHSPSSTRVPHDPRPFSGSSHRAMLLRGPGISPSTVNQACRNCAQSALDIDTSPLSSPLDDANRNNQTSESPNPFITSTPTTPVAIQYPTLLSFGTHQDQQSSPAVGSPTPANPRPLRRRDAVSFIVGEVGLPISEIKREVQALLSSAAGYSPTPVAGTATGPNGCIRPFRVGDVNFESFDPRSLPTPEAHLLMKIDTHGISKAEFAELICFCDICRTYMTKRSIVYHRNCCHGPQSQSAAQAGVVASETVMKRLMRLLASGDPAGGLSEAQFCSLFFKCPTCFFFMTLGLARYHDCVAEAEVDAIAALYTNDSDY